MVKVLVQMFMFENVTSTVNHKSLCKVGSYCDLCMVMFLMFDSVTVNHKSL